MLKTNQSANGNVLTGWDSACQCPASTLMVLEICVKPSSLRDKDWWPWMCQSHLKFQRLQSKIVCFDVSHQQNAGETYVSAWCKPSFKNWYLHQTWDTMVVALGRSHAAPHPLADSEAPIAPRLPPHDTFSGEDAEGISEIWIHRYIYLLYACNV